MPKITDEELEAIQVRLFKNDLDYLRTLFKGSFGVNKAIRNIIRTYVTHVKANADARINALEDDDYERPEATVDLL